MESCNCCAYKDIINAVKFSHRLQLKILDRIHETAIQGLWKQTVVAWKWIPKFKKEIIFLRICFMLCYFPKAFPKVDIIVRSAW